MSQTASVYDMSILHCKVNVHEADILKEVKEKQSSNKNKVNN
jgi:hypothetical protein